jgi:hypothetical protein
MKRLIGLCIGVATALLALGYVGAGNWLGASASAALGCLWLLGLYRGWIGTEALGLIGFAGLAATGARSTVPVPILLASVVVALVAWDLQRFVRRLGAGGQVLDQPALVRSHLRWLLGIAGVGLLISLVGPAIVVPLPFGAMLLLGALLVFGVSRAIGWLNHRA